MLAVSGDLSECQTLSGFWPLGSPQLAVTRACRVFRAARRESALQVPRGLPAAARLACDTHTQEYTTRKRTHIHTRAPVGLPISKEGDEDGDEVGFLTVRPG